MRAKEVIMNLENVLEGSGSNDIPVIMGMNNHIFISVMMYSSENCFVSYGNAVGKNVKNTEETRFINDKKIIHRAIGLGILNLCIKTMVRKENINNEKEKSGVGYFVEKSSTWISPSKYC